jgi:hypothetical protein
MLREDPDDRATNYGAFIEGVGRNTFNQLLAGARIEPRARQEAVPRLPASWSAVNKPD